MNILCLSLGLACAASQPAAIDLGAGFLYDQEHWMACEPLGDLHNCMRVDSTFLRGAPPTHWNDIRVKYWPLGEAICVQGKCPIPQMPFLKQVCGEPGPGEFSFDGTTLNFNADELHQYKWIAITKILRRGPGVHTTADPPNCATS